MHIGVISIINIAAFSDYLDVKQDVSDIKCFSATSVETLVLGLLKFGHKVTIFSTAKGIKKKRCIQGRNLTIYFTPFPYITGIRFFAPLIVPIKIRQMVYRHMKGIDIFHTHWSHYLPIKTTIPQIVTLRDWAKIILKMQHWYQPLMVGQRLMYSLMESIVLHSSKINLVANSSYIHNLILQKTGRDVPIIPNAVEQRFILNTEKESPETFRIISVSASNDKRKNIYTLLKAYKLFREKHNNCELVLVGSPFTNNNPTIQKWNNSNLLDGVILAGKCSHDETLNLIENSSVLVHPSLEESFGNTLIEAMAKKTPVIGGEHSGAVPFVLQQGKAGCLCDITSPKKICQAIEKILTDSHYTQSIVDFAYSEVKQKYTQDVITEKTINLYNTLLQK